MQYQLAANAYVLPGIGILPNEIIVEFLFPHLLRLVKLSILTLYSLCEQPHVPTFDPSDMSDQTTIVL